MNKFILNDLKEDERAKEYCERFLNSSLKKFLFGRNIYANKIIEKLEIDGFIDDFYKENSYLDKPVFKLEEVPHDSLVLVLSGGNTKSALKRVKSFNLEALDYFSFFKYSKSLDLTEISMNEGFQKEFDKNKDRFQWIYSLLSDEVSKKQFSDLVNFRYSYDLKYLKDFTYLEDKQYFEDFLDLNDNEIFLDVGAYDGFTSEEFIKLVPNYSSVHLFEPETQNLKKAKDRLKEYKNIFFHDIGLSNKKETLRFDISGSASKISKEGEIEIKVDRLDDIIKEKVTFIKMDIEGAESLAIEGAKETIKNNHPKLAISVYHKVNDFWKIASEILDIRDDYKIYLRHYTESIYETVMFFIPLKEK